MAIQFTDITFTGVEEKDSVAATHVLTIENARRAALDPPLPPYALTPAAALSASYKTYLLEIIATAHSTYVDDSIRNNNKADEARDRWKISSEAQRDAALAQLEPLP